MTDSPDLEAFLIHNAERWEKLARESKGEPKSADSWFSKASGMHAVIRELRRLRRIEKHARAVDGIFDERKNSICLLSRVADGTVDHREHFLKLRAALQTEVPEPAKTKGPLA